MTSTPGGQILSDVDLRDALTSLESQTDLSDSAVVIAARPDAVAGGSAEALHVLWANGAAVALFGTADAEALGRAVLGSRGRGGVGQALLRLAPGAPPRFERLRLAAGRGLGVALTHVDTPGGRSLYLVAVPGQGGHVAVNEHHASSAAPVAEVAPVQGVAEADPVQGGPEAAPVEAPQPAEADPAKTLASEAPAQGIPRHRMVWQTGADHRLTNLGNVPTGLRDRSTLDQGLALSDIVAMSNDELARSISAALDGRRTWSGVDATWPANFGAGVPASLGAVPVFGRDGRFDGFRGYALVDASRIPTPRPEPLASQPPDFASAPAQVEAFHGPAQGPAIMEAEPGRAAELPVADKVGPPAAPVPEQVVDPIIPSDRTPVEAPAPARSQPGAEVHPSGFASSKVVALRPFAAQVFGPVGPLTAEADPTILPPAPLESHAAGALSSIETTAFQEIGWALNGRADGSLATRGSEATDRPAVETPSSLPQAAEPAGAEGLDAQAYLHGLPVALLVSRDGRAHYLNAAFDALTGYGSAASLERAGGLAHLLGGEPSFGPSEETRFTILSASGQRIEVEGRIDRVAASAQGTDLFTLRRAAMAVDAPRPTAASPQEHVPVASDMLTASIAEPTVLLDRDGLVLALTGAAERLLEQNPKEVVGQTFTHLLAPESRVAATAAIGACASSNATEPQSLDVMVRLHDQALHRFTLDLRRVGRDNVLATWRDASDRSALLARDLADARQEVDLGRLAKLEFLARISHEIRTPLNAILGFAEVILDERFGALGNIRYRDYIRDIHDSGTHVMGLLSDLLDLSKMEAGRLDMSVEALDVNRIVGECVNLLQANAHRERVIMRLSLVPRLPAAMVDERAFRQIMGNILSNAIRFNEPGGQVIVSTAMNEAGAIAVRIRDTGIGMTEAEMATAMEPFRQVAAAGSRAGSGLGLPVTKALVEANHASLTIKSRKDEGTLVEIVLQSAQSEPMRVPAE